MSVPHNMLHVARSRYNVVVPTRYGMMIVNRNDWKEVPAGRYGVGIELLETGEYARNELMHLSELIATCGPDPVLLDIGANIGVHTLFFSDLAGPRGVVHAFEAQRIVFQMLMGNLALNSIENAHGHLVALGAAAGQLKLPPVDYARPWNFGGMGLMRESEKPQFEPGSAESAAADRDETIPVITLDSLNLARVDFIKIDVEGMEEAVLRGARRTLDRCRPLMQVEWWANDEGNLPLYLAEHLDYRVFQAAMNLICVPLERCDKVTILNLPEITPDAVRARFNRS